MTVEALSALRSLRVGPVDPVNPTPAAAPPPSSVQGPDFASVLAEVAAQGMQTLKAGEATALAGVQGRASVQEVVQAVMAIEQTLQAAIAVRDKVVAAYQEISRMAM